MTTSGRLKWGNLVKCREQVRRDAYLTSWSSMMIWTLTPPQNRIFPLDHDHSWTQWMINCERCWTVLQKIQCKTLTNVLCFGECLCRRQWKHLFWWERITQTICSPKIQVNSCFWSWCLWNLNSWYWSNWVRFFWSVSNRLGKFSMETVISGQWWRSHQSLACKCLWILSTSNTVCERQLDWFKDSPHYRTLDTIDGEPKEFELNISPEFTTLQFCMNVQENMNKMSDPAQFQGRIIFTTMFTDIISGTEGIEQECIANAALLSVSICKKMSSRT